MPPSQPALIALQVPQVSGIGPWKAFVYVVIGMLKWKSNSNRDNFSFKLGGKWALFPQTNGKPLALRYRRPSESTTKCTSARAELIALQWWASGNVAGIIMQFRCSCRKQSVSSYVFRKFFCSLTFSEYWLEIVTQEFKHDFFRLLFFFFITIEEGLV